VSETSPDAPDEPVSMKKTSSPGKADRPVPAKVRVPVPVTVKAAMAGLALTVVGAVLRAYAIHSASDKTLGVVLKHSNKHGKKPKSHYIPGDKTFDKDLHTLHTAYTPLAVVAALIAALLILGLRTPRYASATRWFVIVLMLYPTGSLFGALSPYGFPGLAQAAGVLISVGAIGAIVANFLPPSAAYFAACREATTSPERRAAAAQRPKLFGPRPALGSPRQAPARPAARTAAPPAASSGKAKAKARNDADAVARGAELARSRARASKSRRTDV